MPAGAVVVGVDGSEHSARALRWAADQADSTRSPLVVLHGAGESLLVRQSPWSTLEVADLQRLHESLQHAARALVDEAVSVVHADHPVVEVSACVVEADPRDALVSASRTAALVVVGSRGRGQLLSMLGSVRAYVAKHASCPLVVCRPTGSASGGRGVLVGVDGSAADRPALVQAFRMASRRRVPLTVMHCYWEAPALGVGVDTHADLRLLAEEAIAGLREDFPDVRVTVELTRGLVDAVFDDKGDSTDLLVLGRPHASSLSRAIYGHTAVAVLERADTTVMVVPEPQNPDGA